MEKAKGAPLPFPAEKRRKVLISYIESLLSNPKDILIFFLLALPARVMALSIHEWAHAWVANRCGDPTARMLGRMTLNPAAHLDLLGTIMMAFTGFGWAKPVPVNPRNYRNLRRDDIFVSLAGITMNLALFLLSYLVCAIVALIAVHSLPVVDAAQLTASSAPCMIDLEGMRLFFNGSYYITLKDVLCNAPFMADYLIEPVFGRMAGYAFEMLQYFVTVNISLAIFNLIPVPPLDGSHVLNALLPRSPFSNPRIARGAYFALLLFLFSDLSGNILSFVCNGAIDGAGAIIHGLFSLLGLA